MTSLPETMDVNVRGLALVRERLDAFRAGVAPLSALELYHQLEVCTPLLRLHTMLRPGARNRFHSGLQQSYGDHNRLLALGIDRLVASDVPWYRSRLERPDEAGPADLEACAAGVRALDLGREVLASLWVAAALHDYGMLSGRPGGVDVEDGVALSHPILEALCTGPHRALARFVIRNHDYVKDLFDGGVPASFIARQRADLAPEVRGAALPALGIVQVAGAASLGEGRLSRARLGICRRCFDGTALADGTAEARLARLLGDAHLEVPEAARERAGRALADASARAALAAVLDRVLVHGWARARSTLRSAAGAPVAEALLGLLAAAAERWSAAGGGAEHVVLGDGVDAWLARRAAGGPAGLLESEALRLESGALALMLRA